MSSRATSAPALQAVGGGGGTTPPPPGPSHPDDQSRGATPRSPRCSRAASRNYNIEGFAAAAVTGGGNIPVSDARYRQVTTATELVAALRAAKASNANPVNVIEIINDLNMGWNEVGTTLQTDGLLRHNIAPKKHPALIASGVSLLDIMQFNGLTIFSQQRIFDPPRRVQHQGWHQSHPAQSQVRRAVGVGRGHAGAYDSNDWDFVTIGDGSGVTSGIWVDHCTFTKSTTACSTSSVAPAPSPSPGAKSCPRPPVPGSFVQRQFDDLETNRASNPMYNLLRGLLHAAADRRHRAAAEEGSPDRLHQSRGLHHATRLLCITISTRTCRTACRGCAAATCTPGTCTWIVRTRAS